MGVMGVQAAEHRVQAMKIRKRLIAAAMLGAAVVLLGGCDLPNRASLGGSERPNCGSTQIPKSTGGYWKCSFADDFDGASLNRSKWIPQQTDESGYTSGLTACFVDDSKNVSVSEGTLKLTAREESAPFTCTNPNGDFETRYTSGMVSTHGIFSQTYGRFEARLKISPAQVKGLQTSFWLWPTDAGRYGNYPASGEIDIAETYSQYPDRAIPYIHYNHDEPDPNVTNNSCMISDPAAFHTYAAEWTEDSIKIIFDGETCLINRWNPAAPLTNPQPFDQPFFVILTQALGIPTNAFDPETTPLPATTEVDYVRVWELPPVAISGAPGASFGEQPVAGGATAPQNVTVTNTSEDDLHIASVSLAKADPGEFTISGGTCSGATLVPDGTCTFSATFDPTTAGAKSAQVEIVGDAPLGAQTATLLGTGLPPGASPAPSATGPRAAALKKCSKKKGKARKKCKQRAMKLPA